jgi:tRNA(adenine34) deaminase
MKGEYLALAVEKAQIGALNGEIPVGAVIVKNNEILAATFNKKEELGCSTKHAEILAIEEASKKLQDWRLNDCDMYLTMEPCLMCCGALIQARIRNVYYVLNNNKFGGINFINYLNKFEKYNHNVNYVKINDEKIEKELENIMKTFFIDKR